jgi:hypothetical protein
MPNLHERNDLLETKGPFISRIYLDWWRTSELASTEELRIPYINALGANTILRIPKEGVVWARGRAHNDPIEETKAYNKYLGHTDRANATLQVVAHVASFSVVISSNETGYEIRHYPNLNHFDNVAPAAAEAAVASEVEITQLLMHSEVESEGVLETQAA